MTPCVCGATAARWSRRFQLWLCHPCFRLLVERDAKITANKSLDDRRR